MGDDHNHGSHSDETQTTEPITDKHINYDPSEKEEGITYIDSGLKISPNENGEYIVWYSLNPDDYHGSFSRWIDAAPNETSLGIEQNLTFAEYSKYTPLQFIEFGTTENNGQRCEPDLIIGGTTENIGVHAFGQLPKEPSEQQTLLYQESIVNSGKYGYYDTILHETGHTLGLIHPGIGNHEFDTEDARLNITSPINFNRHYNIISPTVMHARFFKIQPNTLMPWDIATIQEKYGTNPQHNAGNTTHTLGTEGVQTYWDAGGSMDVLSTEGAKSSASISLWEGINHPSIIEQSITYLAYGSNIEGAIGGEAKDNIVGNNMDNRLEGRGDEDVLRGNGGNDTYVGGDEDDTFDLRATDINGNTVAMGHDVIEDFETHWADYLANEDILLVGDNVHGATMYKDGNDVVILFEDANGQTIPNSSVTLKNFDGFWNDIDIHRVNTDGTKTEFGSDEITITNQPPPSEYKLSTVDTDQKRSMFEENTDICDCSNQGTCSNTQDLTVENTIKLP